jgi:putative transferase (TIGR04331 family)
MNQPALTVVSKSGIPLLIETANPGDFSLFPSEAGGGVKITNEEMLQLSCIYSKLYIAFISRMSDHLVRQFELNESAASLLARRALVPLTHCFLDRLVRVKKAIDCAPGQLSTPRQELFLTTDTIEAFEEYAVANPAFNQSMIGFLGRIWLLPESAPAHVVPQFKPQAGFKNNMFQLHHRSTWRLIKKIALRLLAKMPKSRFATLSMANATGAFFEHGFYSQYLSEVSFKNSLNVKERNIELRDSIFSNDFIETTEWNQFLSKLGLSIVEQERTCQALKVFLKLYYPPSLLEAIPESMQQAVKALQSFKKTVLISSSGQSTEGTYVVAAAKQIGLSIVDYQHGGHYGYIKDVSVILELEYPGVDQFVSWGWSRLPDHLALNGLTVYDLPSPWLSERKRYWAGLNLGGERKYDFLLMPNMVKRFPAAPHGASTSRIDLVQELACSLKNLVRKVTENGLSVLHKPYNSTTVKILAKTMQELASIGGEKYFCDQQLDKGLTYELLQECNVVLWDQPGTGFLECITSGIPTMVYWTRIYSQEEEWTKPIFLELEQQGVIHRNTDSLIEEMLRFKMSPSSWMIKPERVSLIGRFCCEFARTSKEWPVYWRRYLDGLTR